MRRITIYHAEVTGKCRTVFEGVTLSEKLDEGDLIVAGIEAGDQLAHARFAKGTWIYYVLAAQPKAAG